MEKIAQHAHCHMCGKAVPYGETLCSDECKEKYNAFVKKRKMYLYFMYIALALLIVIFIFSYVGV